MGGRSYYCDYCQCFMKNDVNVRKNHNVGMLHNIAKANYLAEYKDPQQIISDESKKIPCKRFLNNQECQFGYFCHFSHCSAEQLSYLKSLVELKKCRNEQKEDGGKSLTETAPWKYPKDRMLLYGLPPSLQQIDLNNATESGFAKQWG